MFRTGTKRFSMRSRAGLPMWSNLSGKSRIESFTQTAQSAAHFPFTNRGLVTFAPLFRDAQRMIELGTRRSRMSHQRNSIKAKPKAKHKKDRQKGRQQGS